MVISASIQLISEDFHFESEGILIVKQSKRSSAQGLFLCVCFLAFEYFDNLSLKKTDRKK